MTDHLQPTEEYDGRLRVRLLEDGGESRDVPCSSYPEAVELVKEHQHSVTAVKIVDRDDDVVFTSTDMEIDVWESIWRDQKRREAVGVEERACPYNSISCFADDLCVECKMDKIQSR